MAGLEEVSLGVTRSPARIAAAAAVFATLALLVFYHQTAASMLALWRNSSAYGHGVIVLAVSLGIVWKHRHRLLSQNPQPKLWGIVLVLTLSLCWLVASAIGVQVVEQLLVVLLIAAMVLTIIGPRGLACLSFPFAYFLLAVPIWSIAIPVLQWATAVAATNVLVYSGVPVLLQGNFLSIPSGNFVVADVCAGLRFLLATMSIAALYAYLADSSFRRRVLFFCLAIAVAVFFNWVRVVIIIAVGHVTQMQHSLIHHHAWFGWVVFAVSLVPLFVAASWILRPSVTQARSRPPLESVPCSARLIAVATVSALFASATGPATDFFLEGRAAHGQTAGQIALPAGAEWAGPHMPAIDWRPHFAGVDVEHLDSYRKDRNEVIFYVGYYHHQRQGAELINARNAIFDPTVWQLVGEQRADIAADGPLAWTAAEKRIRSVNGEALLIWTWYYSGGQYTANPYWAKVLQLRGLFTGDSGAAVLALATAGGSDIDAGRRVLMEFAEYTGAPLVSSLRELAARSGAVTGRPDSKG